MHNTHAQNICSIEWGLEGLADTLLHRAKQNEVTDAVGVFIGVFIVLGR